MDLKLIFKKTNNYKTFLLNFGVIVLTNNTEMIFSY